MYNLVVETAPTITLHTQPGFCVPGREPCFSGTPFGIKVERVLRFKRLPFRVQEVLWQERASVLPRLSRSRKLPVLEYDGALIEDSTSIAHFLEERHPKPRLTPLDPLEAATSRLLEDWADEALYFYRTYGMLRLGGELTIRYLTPPIDRELADRLDDGIRSHLEQVLDAQGIGRYPREKFELDLARCLDALETRVASLGHLAGSTLSFADLAVFGQFARLLSGTDPWFEERLASRRALRRWYEVVGAETVGER